MARSEFHKYFVLEIRVKDMMNLLPFISNVDDKQRLSDLVLIDIHQRFVPLMKKSKTCTVDTKLRLRMPKHMLMSLLKKMKKM